MKHRQLFGVALVSCAVLVAASRAAPRRLPSEGAYLPPAPALEHDDVSIAELRAAIRSADGRYVDLGAFRALRGRSVGE
jgi:hypothetical protein